MGVTKLYGVLLCGFLYFLKPSVPQKKLLKIIQFNRLDLND